MHTSHFFPAYGKDGLKRSGAIIKAFSRIDQLGFVSSKVVGYNTAHMDGVCCVMISIPQREQVRLRTLEQLQPLGFDARVFVRPDLPLGSRNHHAVVVEALNFGLASGCAHILFLEDDLDFSAKLPTAFTTCARSGAPVVTLYCAGYRFYPPALKRALKRDQPYKSGLYRVMHRRIFYGSQALVMTREFVEWVLRGWRRGYLDTRIARIAPASMMLYAPNPVQHYGACLKSTWGFFRWYHDSQSFRP